MYVTIITGENGDLVADTTDLLYMWKKYFHKLLNVDDELAEVEYTEHYTSELHIQIPSFKGHYLQIKKY